MDSSDISDLSDCCQSIRHVHGGQLPNEREWVVTLKLDELALQYLSERVARGELDPMTARNHRSALNRFAESVGPKSVARLSTADVERWLETRSHLKPSTRRSQFSYVVLFCGWLHKQGYVAKNVALDLRPPRVPRAVPRALPPASVTRVLHHCPDERARAIVWLMVGLGLRCCEIANLRMEDWDRQARLMTVTGKGANERALPVPAEVEGAVDAYLDRFPASFGPIIRSYRQPSKGLGSDTISGMVAEWMRSAGVKRRSRDGVSAHCFRHTAASDVLDNCNDLRVVQQMLGHSNLTTTTIYLRRASMGKMREAMAGRTYLS